MRYTSGDEYVGQWKGNMVRVTLYYCCVYPFSCNPSSGNRNSRNAAFCLTLTRVALTRVTLPRVTLAFFTLARVTLTLVQRHGKGQLSSVTGSVYEGEWSWDMRSGMGTLTCKSAGRAWYQYEGEWKNDQVCTHAFYSPHN